YYTAAAEEKINQDTVALVETIVSKVNALYANQNSTSDLTTKIIARQILGAKTKPSEQRNDIEILVPGSTGTLSVIGSVRRDIKNI
ncbi:hypothetical protein, partial [Escherichia coli]|uniref:hypothetical protein n=1 Tax=Escherichia coli TaxID=562 RepID=UPI000A5C01E0